MRWNCPHCSTALAVSDEQMGTGWTFTRCYQCGGFGLVRRNETSAQTAYGVARPAPIEPVLAPMPPSSPLLSEKAIKNLAQPVVLPSKRPPQAPATAFPGPMPTSLVDSIATATGPTSPESTVEASSPRTISPVAASVLVLIAVVLGSGYFVVDQGRALLREMQKKPTPAAQVHATARTVAATQPAAPVIDQVAQSASAPVSSAAMPAGLKAEVRVSSAALRALPSTDGDLVARAPLNARFEIVGWKDNWFEVKLPPSGSSESAPTRAWIRNDLVQLITR